MNKVDLLFEENLYVVSAVCHAIAALTISVFLERRMKRKGMWFGHKAFCPVMSVYRIKKEALGTCETKQKARRRFENECLRFLAYGLKLEDKCFVPGDFL